jgi:hypothetical protein
VAERVCLYALVAGAETPLRATGISGERLRVVRMEGVDAVVGLVARPPKPTIAAIRRYDEVERAVMASYASVLPARFGTCAPAVDALAASVRDRRVTIRRNLGLVRRRVQMTVRVFTDSGPAASRMGAISPPDESATRGTQYLKRRVEQTRVPGASGLRPAVAKWVRAERSERHSGGRLAGTLYHLVPRSAVPAYRRALSDAAMAAGLTTVVSGPWPPYAFAD